jgi:outer membrane protein assembly factor BamB
MSGITPRKPWSILVLLTLVSALLAGCSGGGAVASSWPGVTVDDSKAYIATGPAVYAVDLVSGQERWRFPAEADRDMTFFAAPALTDDGDLIVGGYNATVYRLDAEDGGIVWTFNGVGARIVGSPVVAGELVLVPSSDHTLYALRLSSGQAAWRFDTEHALWAAPLADGDRLYLAALDHHVYALDLASGDLLWSQDVGGAAADTPVLSDGLLLVGTFGNGLQAVSAENGEPQWSFASDGWVWGGPAVNTVAAFFGDVAGVMYALDPRTGDLLWRLQPDGPVVGTPAVDSDRVFFGTESGTVYARRAENGDPLWENALDGKALSDPILAGDVVLVAATGGEVLLTALSADSGAVRWSFTPTSR